MAKSPEYPDLNWVQPRSWTNANRDDVQLIVIHTTEGSAHAGSAEDGAAYDARRTDGTSTHYFVDSDSVVQCVRTNDQAHAARAQGNRRGIQYELCARAGYSEDWWGSLYALSMMKRAAEQAARDAKKWDIPVRHLTVAQVRDGAKGFCGHYDVTRAFPQDNGTHTDPGANFPWSVFLTMVRIELAPKPDPEEIDMDKAELRAEVKAAVQELLLDDDGAVARVQRARPWQYAGNGLQGATSSLDALADGQQVLAQVTALTAELAEIKALLTQTQG